MQNCPDCNGTGFVQHHHDLGSDFLPCHFCDGSGQLDLDARLNEMEAAFAANYMYGGIAEYEAVEDVDW